MPYIAEPTSTSDQESRSEDERRTEKIRVKNRRKLYLDRHPSYFTSPDLELSDPLLYDRCVRRFQTPAEREANGKAKGYSGVLEADLYRSEAKLAAIRRNAAHLSDNSVGGPSSSSRVTEETLLEAEDEEDAPKTKEEGWDRWKWAMTLKFLNGDDGDFEYKDVDEGEEYDEVDRREREEKWFEEEEPQWADDISAGDGVGNDRKGTGGETGIQDF